MRLKICDSHLTCKVANKFLNVCEWVEVVEWNKRWSPPFPCCSVSCQCLKENPYRKKKQFSLLTSYLATKTSWLVVQTWIATSHNGKMIIKTFIIIKTFLEFTTSSKPI